MVMYDSLVGKGIVHCWCTATLSQYALLHAHVSAREFWQAGHATGLVIARAWPNPASAPSHLPATALELEGWPLDTITLLQGMLLLMKTCISIGFRYSK
jgi:hypothetical protein